MIKICKQFHFRNILVGVKDVSTPKKKKNAYIYLDFFFLYLFLFLDKQGVFFFFFLRKKTGELVEKCSYFVGNVLVQVRHVFSPHYLLILSLLKLRGVRVF